MAFQKSYDDLLPVSQPACVHLRHKSMYVRGSLRTPEIIDDSSSHACWCNQTQHVIGPDQQAVNRRECTSGRNCFSDTHS